MDIKPFQAGNCHKAHIPCKSLSSENAEAGGFGKVLTARKLLLAGGS
jgi:hypothetical protein